MAEYEAVWKVGDEVIIRRYSKDDEFTPPRAPEGCQWKYLGLRHEDPHRGHFILMSVEAQNA